MSDLGVDVDLLGLCGIEDAGAANMQFLQGCCADLTYGHRINHPSCGTDEVQLLQLFVLIYINQHCCLLTS